MIQGLATRWLASLPGRASHPLECTTLPGRTSQSFFIQYPVTSIQHQVFTTPKRYPYDKQKEK